MKMLGQLPVLQLEQQRHDDTAHKDILCLPVQDRVKHMVLHFAKYCGHLAGLQVSYDRSLLEATIVDTSVICLACANALNVKLAELIQMKAFEPCDPSLSEREVCASYFTRYAATVGRMAKACESLDHFEKFDYRGTLEQGVSTILCLTGAVADHLSIDLPTYIRARWKGIEQRLNARRDTLGGGSDKLRLAAK